MLTLSAVHSIPDFIMPKAAAKKVSCENYLISGLCELVKNYSVIKVISLAPPFSMLRELTTFCAFCMIEQAAAAEEKAEEAPKVVEEEKKPEEKKSPAKRAAAASSDAKKAKKRRKAPFAATTKRRKGGKGKPGKKSD